MNKIVIILIATVGMYQWYSNNKQIAGDYGEPHSELIMYSLTTCGFCKKKRKELRAENISFTEYFIDEDRGRRDELNTKLNRAGLPPKSYGTPIFDAHGVMLPNNPSLNVIRENIGVY